MKKLSVILLLLGSLSLFAQGATSPGFAISSVAFASPTTTVNTSTAHGLVVNQGFCITGSSVSADNVCGIVATAPTSTSFTFSNAAAFACATGCGTVFPAKQIIALDITKPPADQTANYLCWVTNPNGIANSSLTSLWSGASPAEVNAIKAGLWVETQHSMPAPPGMTLATFKQIAQQTCSSDQSKLTSGFGAGAIYGNFFDGTGWLN